MRIVPIALVCLLFIYTVFELYKKQYISIKNAGRIFLYRIYYTVKPLPRVLNRPKFLRCPCDVVFI